MTVSDFTGCRSTEPAVMPSRKSICRTVSVGPCTRTGMCPCRTCVLMSFPVVASTFPSTVRVSTSSGGIPSAGRSVRSTMTEDSIPS